MTALAQSPDGRLVVTSASDGATHVWDAASLRAVATLPSTGGPAQAAAVRPDGLRLAVAEGRQVQLWDTGTWRPVQPALGRQQQWLDAAFRSRGLPTPTAQIDANSIPLLPRLIARTHLLRFLSRHTLNASGAASALREVPLKETTLRRHLGVTYRREGYLSPAAQRLVTLLRSRGKRLFTSALGGEAS